jgi:hypothetical protein
MPRKNPEEKKTYTRKSSPDLEPVKSHEHSATTQCTNRRCNGFMFLVIAKYAFDDRVHDELECFTCRRIKKLGPHDPHRPKPTLSNFKQKHKR